jgi:hypothetical protein
MRLGNDKGWKRFAFENKDDHDSMFGGHFPSFAGMPAHWMNKTKTEQQKRRY